MNIERIEGSTRTFGAPPDRIGGGKWVGLPVLDVETPEGPFMVSAWSPTPAELEALQCGETLKLWVRGTVHPVVGMSVGPLP